MIPIVREAEDMYNKTGVYEVCYFCKLQTVYWHEKTNTPVCSVCAERNSESDIKRKAYHFSKR